MGPATGQNAAALQRDIVRSFRMEGLIPQAASVKALISVLSREQDSDAALEVIVRAIKERIERREVSSALVTVELIEKIVADLTQTDEDVGAQALQVFDSFKIPALRFDSVIRKYLLEEGPRRLFGDPATKTAMFRERFKLMQQRVKRCSIFSPPVIRSAEASYIEVRVLGMLVRGQNGTFVLEDLTATVALNFSEAQPTSGLITENCIVLVEGVMQGEVLHIHSIGFPPPEPRAQTVALLGQQDALGLKISAQRLREMKEMEERAEDSMFVILSDVHLDQPKVIEKLHMLFEGFSAVVPTLFVLMGNFTSEPIGHGALSMSDYHGCFQRLLTVIQSYPALVEGSAFLFIPGPQDPGYGNILPRPGLASFFTEGLRTKLPHCHFPSNPARVRFYTKEFVFFRADILNKMRRHCVLPPQDCEEQHLEGEEENMEEEGQQDGDKEKRKRKKIQPSEHLVKTIVEQAHLCPLPLSARPIHWQYDNALRLTPLPHVLVLADHTDQYQWGYADSLALNPGPFNVDYSFVVHRVTAGETEFSRIDD